MNRLTWAVLSGAVLSVSGCRSDGGVGVNGAVRFSQVVNFAETDDFTPPLVVGRTVLIALQHPSTAGAFDGEHGFPELDLNVTGGDAKVLPLGFSQFAVELDEEKTYNLQATRDGTAIDSIPVVAQKGSALRLHEKVAVTTALQDGTKRCATTEEKPVSGLTLARNQSVALTVVPIDGDGKPMLGMLHLTAKVTSGPAVALDTAYFTQFGSANALIVDGSTLDANGSTNLEIHEPAFDTLSLALQVSKDDVTGSCP